jgi:hypothetical protein
MTVNRHATNPGRHSFAERGPDLYQTPACAVHALLRAEQLPHRIWEPACGPGAIAKVLRETGRFVVARDLHDWGCPESESGINFLQETRPPAGVTAVVTNPPFKLADLFVAHALLLVSHVYMLLRLAFLESARRTPILESGRLARVHVFRDRLPMMHRHGWNGPRASSSTAYAWFVFDQQHGGPATIDRISARTEGATAGRGTDNA